MNTLGVSNWGSNQGTFSVRDGGPILLGLELENGSRGVQGVRASGMAKGRADWIYRIGVENAGRKFRGISATRCLTDWKGRLTVGVNVPRCGRSNIGVHWQFGIASCA